MKRRDLMKSCLIAPFFGLFKKKTETSTSCASVRSTPSPSGDQSRPSSSSCSSDIPALPVEDWWVDAQFNPVIDLQFNEPFEGKVVGMCEFQGNLWIATERGVYRIKNYET